MPRKLSRLVSASATAAVLCGTAAGAISPPPQGWTRSDLEAVTQPVLVGGHLLVYAASNGGLRLVALKPRSGSTAWSVAASASATTPGESPAVASTGSRVIYLRPLTAQVAMVAARDARSGRQLWQSTPGIFTSWPSFCPDQATAVCLTGSVAGQASRGAELRFDVRTGRSLPSLVFARSPAGRSVGRGLFDPAQRSPEYLVGVSGGRVAWRKPLAEIFTLPGASTDWGWSFERIARLGLFVGNPGWPPVERSGNTGVLDASRTMTAGFRIRDGRTVWRNSGSTYICNYLPCPGASQGGGVSPAASAQSPSLGVRLRSQGTMRISLTGSSLPVASRAATVTLEGFDLRSGRTIWSFDAGHNPGLIAETLLPAQIGSSTILLRDRSGRLVRLDLADGSHRRAAAAVVGWCRKPTSYVQSVAYQANNGVNATTYYGQNALFPCDARQRRAGRPARIPAFVGAIGARAGELAIWTDTTGVVAAPAAG